MTKSIVQGGTKCLVFGIENDAIAIPKNNFS